MAKIELELTGTLPRGKVWVNCPDRPGVCFQDPMPAPPVLKEGQRAVWSTLPGHKPEWFIREAKTVSGGESAGISFLTVLVMIWVYDRWKGREKDS